MNAIKMILVIILMFTLRNLYHKMFRVVYFNAVTAIFREFAICFLIAVVIVFGGFELIGDIFTPKEKDPGFYGTYHNTSLLDGGDAEVTLTISGGNDLKDGKMGLSGYALAAGSRDSQHLNMEAEIPKGNTFTCTDEAYHITLTITADPKHHTLEVVQENGYADKPFWFSGTYVDPDTWEQMSDEVEEAKEEAVVAQTPNKWLSDYFGEYTLLPYMVMEKGSHPAQFSISLDPSYNDCFLFDYLAEENGTRYSKILRLPYPLGDSEPGWLAYEMEEGWITFEVREDPGSGRVEIEIAEFPYPALIGVYIPSDSQLYESDMPEPGHRLWDGVYTCTSDGPDGTKTLSITQNLDSTLSISMYHRYADGREDILDIVAGFGPDGHTQYFAQWNDARNILFNLSDDCSTIEISQIGIYPAIDLEFQGVYTLEN